MSKVSEFNKRLRRERRKRLELLSEWYGREFAATEIAAHISTPVPLGQGVRAVMAQLETPEKNLLCGLRNVWSRIVGVDLAKLVEPLDWKDRTLILEVRHSALLRELKPSLELLRSAVNRQFPDADCREVKLTISGGGRRYLHRPE